jgi:hypothetical protein
MQFMRQSKSNEEKQAHLVFQNMLHGEIQSVCNTAYCIFHRGLLSIQNRTEQHSRHTSKAFT